LLLSLGICCRGFFFGAIVGMPGRSANANPVGLNFWQKIPPLKALVDLRGAPNATGTLIGNIRIRYLRTDCCG
jgi:hypothetical protein